MTVCYFTGSGNCLYVARRIGGILLSIPQLMRQESIEIADEAVRITPITKAQMALYQKRLARRWLRKDTALSYTVNDSCIHCGVCVKVCPANNITVTKEKVTFSDHCEVCYACLHNCPQHAIHMPLEAGTAQFRNKHVSLQDMVAANE